MRTRAAGASQSFSLRRLGSRISCSSLRNKLCKRTGKSADRKSTVAPGRRGETVSYSNNGKSAQECLFGCVDIFEISCTKVNRCAA